MTQEELQKHLYRNSISNYVFLVVRLGLGLVLFRLIFQELTREEYGIWVLIWSVIGFGIILDFGFGFTAQKRVAEFSAHKQWDQLSRVLSTMFVCYVVLGIVMIVFGLLASPYLIEVFKEISPENKERFTLVFMITFIGMGLNFPIGIFPEMLRGQQRLALANYTLLAGYLVQFALAGAVLYYNLGLVMLLLATLGCSLLSELMCGLFALRNMPQVRIRPRLFSRKMVHNTMQFSVFAYITTLTTLILTRTDQLILGTALAVGALAIYGPAAKVAEMFMSFSLQVPETLSPAAAHLHARGDKERLRSLLVNGTRYSVMISTPLYIGAAFYLGEILRLLTGEAVPGEMYWVGQVLLLWGYTMLLTQSVTKRIFMMSGHERRLMWLGVGEALLNLVLSLALVLYFKNVVCVAIGSLVATFFFGWFCLWPWAAREASLSPWNLARTVLLPTWFASLPIVGIILIERQLTHEELRSNFYILALEGLLTMALAVFFLWRMALKDEERARFSAYFDRFFSKGTAA